MSNPVRWSRLFYLVIVLTITVQAQSLYVEPVSYSKVLITDHFWKSRLDKIATATIPACVEQTEIKTPRIRNFEVAAGMREGKFEGIFYDDSDVYKALEAIAYSLKNNPDPALEKKADEWIDKIAAAQLTDGYINTYYTLTGLDKRWTDMSMHEDYNGGHLIEAAVAYYQTTGKRKLLDVAILFADHFDSLFGPGKRNWVTGHQELELALVKLYKVTQDKRYLNLADWLLSQRGQKLAIGYTWTDWRDTAYAQDVRPVKKQREITGHAVRAMYLYTGAADVAALTGDAGYMEAMKAVWEDVVHRNMYLTGGIGSSGRNEGFSVDYDLPNLQAYCETCASVGMVFWNQRMNMLTGESQYIDVLERSLYNGAQSGLSLSGDRFFYGNPLASFGTHNRREWFGTACCPANIARLTASVGDYIYGVSPEGIWVNLFIGSSTSVVVNKKNVGVSIETRYPQDGQVKIKVDPQSKNTFTVRVRIPGWTSGSPVPGELYHFHNPVREKILLQVNGKPAAYELKNGYAAITREWKKGDSIDLLLPMEVMEVVASEKITQNRDRVALQRGPLVYCVEGADNDKRAWNFVLPENTSYRTSFNDTMLGGVVTIQFDSSVVETDENGQSVKTVTKTITAIPYFLWNNRGQNEMQVWLPRKINALRINPD
jgi:uncharacterized protein